jgi:hypothetical protein
VARRARLWRTPLALGVACALAPLLVLACRRASVAECEALWSTANDELSKVVDRQRACTRDEDCELVTSPYGCLWSCDTAIARPARGMYEATRRRLQAMECKEWHERGCRETTPKPMPSCAPLVARCQDNRCTGVDEPRTRALGSDGSP